ncbi:MAG: plastocyanin, partial [Polaromonas sp.]|nr:plastocyanin [Polaromonas sp.]
MKKILLLSVLSTLCAWASAGSLVVAVLDKEGKPVPDAVVVVIPANKTALPKTALPQHANISQEKMQFIP